MCLSKNQNYSLRHGSDRGATDLKQRRYGASNSFHFVWYVGILWIVKLPEEGTIHCHFWHASFCSGMGAL